MKKDEYLVTVGGRQFSVRTISERRVAVNGVEHQAYVQPMWTGGAVLHLDGKVFRVDAHHPTPDGKEGAISISGKEIPVIVDDRRSQLLKSLKRASADEGGILQIKAPMPGLVVRIEVKPGQVVQKGAGLVVLEAMKMENELRADRPARVLKVTASEKMAVEKGTLLVVLDTKLD